MWRTGIAIFQSERKLTMDMDNPKNCRGSQRMTVCYYRTKEAAEKDSKGWGKNPKVFAHETDLGTTIWGLEVDCTCDDCMYNELGNEVGDVFLRMKAYQDLDDPYLRYD